MQRGIERGTQAVVKRTASSGRNRKGEALAEQRRYLFDVGWVHPVEAILSPAESAIEIANDGFDSSTGQPSRVGARRAEDFVMGCGHMVTTDGRLSSCSQFHLRGLFAIRTDESCGVDGMNGPAELGNMRLPRVMGRIPCEGFREEHRVQQACDRHVLIGLTIQFELPRQFWLWKVFGGCHGKRAFFRRRNKQYEWRRRSKG